MSIRDNIYDDLKNTINILIKYRHTFAASLMHKVLEHIRDVYTKHPESEEVVLEWLFARIGVYDFLLQGLKLPVVYLRPIPIMLPSSSAYTSHKVLMASITDDYEKVLMDIVKYKVPDEIAIAYQQYMVHILDKSATLAVIESYLESRPGIFHLLSYYGIGGQERIPVAIRHNGTWCDVSRVIFNDPLWVSELRDPMIDEPS